MNVKSLSIDKFDRDGVATDGSYLSREFPRN